MSSTLPARDDLVAIGGQISSGSSNYQVQSFLGQGSFGRVVKCTRMEDMKTVAIKMLKDAGSNMDWAKKEVTTLSKLRSLDPDKCNLVRWYQSFTYRGHTCLEFEHLEKSLCDFMKERHFQPLHLKEIRPIVTQLAIALYYLSDSKIIHADLKLENVMLVNHAQEPYRVKLIDFGLALEFSDTKIGSYIQTRPYRSPELILGYAFTEAIDMWSLGCLAASLYLGALLFPGTSEYDMMRYITETLGQPPDLLLGYGYKTSIFFRRVENSPTSRWKLKTPEQFHRETGIWPQETRQFKLRSLKDLLHIQRAVHGNFADKDAEMSDLSWFVDLLEGMLHLDDHKRITPRQVLEHPFIKLSHIAELYGFSPHVQSCYKIMDVCIRTPTSKAGKAACSSVQQPSSRTAQPVQQIPHPPPAQNGLRQPNSLKSKWHSNVGPSTSGSSKDSSAVRRPPVQHTDASKSSHTQSSIRHGLKRKMADGEDVRRHQSNSDHHKRSHEDVKRFRESGAGPSTSCSNKDSSAVRGPPVQHSDASKSSHTQSSIRHGLKRKMAYGEDVRRHQSNSDHHKRSHEDVKRFRESGAGPSTSCSSRTQSHISPKLKRKLAQDADSDSHEMSGHKRVRESHAGLSTSSSSQGCSNAIHVSTAVRRPPAQYADTSRSSYTQSLIRHGLKQKMADGEGVRCQRANPYHYKRSREDVKRFRESDAGPSTSCSNQTQSHISPRLERRLTHKEDSGRERMLPERRYQPLHRPELTAHSINPQPCTSTQNTSSVKSGIQG